MMANYTRRTRAEQPKRRRQRRPKRSGVPRRLRTDEAVMGYHRVAFGVWPAEGQYAAAEAAGESEADDGSLR